MSPRIASAGLRPFSLPLRAPWRFHGSTVLARRGWLVRLETTDGRVGWGEATPLPEAGTETADTCRRWLDGRMPPGGIDVAQALGQLPDAPGPAPAARCGLEMALLDLTAQARGLPLSRLLHPDAPGEVAVNASLGPLDQVTRGDLERAVAEGFRCLKLKVGLGDPAVELARLRDLAAGLPVGVQLRLDANRAWAPAAAEAFLAGIADLPVDLIEEPLQTPTLAGLQRLQAVSRRPLALDESLGPIPLQRVLDRRAAGVLVLKPMRLGGILPCLETGRRARDAGLDCLVTTTLDGALAVHAAAHLAAALTAAGTRLAHGLATSGWLAADLADAPRVSLGRLELPTRPGLGCAPSLDPEHSHG